jgi:hypothetical protein
LDMETLIVDTSVFITLCHSGRTDLLARLPWTFRMTDDIEVEIEREDQIKVLQGLKRGGHLAALRVEGLEALQAYSKLRKRIDPGECSALVLAQDKHWLFACEEANKVFLSCIDETIAHARLVACRHLFLEAICEGLMDLAEADAIRASMARKKQWFTGRFKDFASLLSNGRHPALERRQRLIPAQ